MKKSILALSVTALLVGCGGGGSGTSSEDGGNWNEGSRKDPAYAGPFVCEITSDNGPDAEQTPDRAYPVDKHGRFFGDSISLNGACSGGDYQIKEYRWELAKEPSRSEAQLFHEGNTGGVAPQNTLQFFTGEFNFMADGEYVVTLYAINSEGISSPATSYKIDYIAAHYLHGAYLGSDGDGNAIGNLSDTIDMDDTTRPYYIAGPVVAKYINIEAGVEVYSSGCNGWEETGYGCELVAYEEININGTASNPVELYNSVLRASDEWPAVLTVNHARFEKGLINYNALDNIDMEFEKITIDNSVFVGHHGIVLTGDGDTITNSRFIDGGHEFTLDGRKAIISVADAENVLIKDNIFTLTDTYSIGISADVTQLPYSDYFAVGNTHPTNQDEAIFDGYDATYESHGDAVSFVTTFISL